MIGLCKALRAISFHPDIRFTTAETVLLFHENGLYVIPWSHPQDNTSSIMQKSIQWGVDGFFANNVQMFQSVLTTTVEGYKKQLNYRCRCAMIQKSIVAAL